MSSTDADTILAVSSPPGAAAAAVVRLSGPAALERVASLAVEGGPEVLRARGASELRVVLGLEGFALPARASIWRAPRSYTREDLVELCVPGSPPLVAMVARALAAPRGAGGSCVRWALPGELTQRAFLNGRIDLTQAESVATLIGAAGEEEARASQRGLRGELRGRVDDLARGIVEAVALLEAAIDFPDEDLPQVSTPALIATVRVSIDRIAELRRSSALRIPSGGALRVVLAGFPNAGKSSLLNAILGRRAAITSVVPGTTRDPVRGATSHAGRRIEWIDVAGAFDGELDLLGGESEEERPIWDAVRRLTRVEMENADCVLWVVDPTAQADESLARFRALEARAKLLVIQKCDRLTGAEMRRWISRDDRPLLVSAKRRTGLEPLVERVLGSGSAAEAHGRRGSPVFLVSAHQETQLAVAHEALTRAEGALSASRGIECAAADLRDAALAVDQLRGASSREAVLDLVFSRFCIGK